MSHSFKPIYRKSRRFDRSCRCHGSCDYCRSNRLHNDRKNRQAAEQTLKDYLKGKE